MKDLFSPTEAAVGGQRLLLSMSGGRTSAYMTHQVLTRFRHLWDEVVVVFANTGQEHEKTLEFVHQCDQHFGFGTVWVEAVVHHGERRASSHRVVTFETASRAGEPYEEVIRKYGIANLSHPHCNRELKLNPIHDYVQSLGWEPGSYATAIGLRPDELRRVRKDAVAAQIVYPLIDWSYADKIDVLSWWEDQPFDLQIQEHQGNCTWCWKKSFAKHHQLLQESPGIYAFPARMEALYSRVGAEFEGQSPWALPRVFFRGNTSTLDLPTKCAAEVAGPRRRVSDEDENGGCSESCEMYPTTDTRTADLFALAPA